MTDTDWINWWCCTWRWMHPGWQARLLAEQGVPLEAFMAVSRSRHGELLHCLGITPSQPPEPVADVMQWLSLSDAQREQALTLVQAICFTVDADTQAQTGEHWSWCRSLAKALRPGLWLAGEVTDARAMLGPWLGESCWSRLRLAWSPEDNVALALNLPARKLDALWRAVLWKVNAMDNTSTC
ncbi:type III secretion protein [Pseudomonas sp. SDO528_S397]